MLCPPITRTLAGTLSQRPDIARRNVGLVSRRLGAPDSFDGRSAAKGEKPGRLNDFGEKS
jgi:hypothetical protein